MYFLLQQVPKAFKPKAFLRRALPVFTASLTASVTVSLTLLGGAFLAFSDSRVAAQQIDPELRQTFLADPLEDRERDSLLPELTVERSLSPLELSALEDDLDRLNRLAQQQLIFGESDEAFEIWRRELRLRRILGPEQEFEAIQRQAEISWNQQRSVDVQLLTLRTREIWETVQAALGLPTGEGFGEEPADGTLPASALVGGNAATDILVLQEIAQTFNTLRDIDSTVEVLEALNALTEPQSNTPAQPQIEQQIEPQVALAELHLQWFRFAEAADVYLELLASARESGNVPAETRYLERLVYSYQEADSLTNAVRAQTDLIALYQAQGTTEKLPGLLVAIAQNYRALNLHQNAIDYYRSAYSAAQRFEQFSFSAQVLQDLGTLYESLALTDDALGAYNLLIPVERQAYNTYGTMNAYDSIGQLQRRLGNSFEALKAFEQALVIANQLNIREEYFIEQIESVIVPSMTPDEPAPDKPEFSEPASEDLNAEPNVEDPNIEDPEPNIEDPEPELEEPELDNSNTSEELPTLRQF